MIVRAGHIKIGEKSEKVQDRRIDKIVVHEKFNNINLFNDITMVLLENDFKLSDTVNPICIPEQDHEFTGQNCIVSGFGKF